MRRVSDGLLIGRTYRLHLMGGTTFLGSVFRSKDTIGLRVHTDTPPTTTPAKGTVSIEPEAVIAAELLED